MDNIESHQVSGTSTKAALHFHLTHPQQPSGLPTLQFHLNGLLEAQNHLYPLIPLAIPFYSGICVALPLPLSTSSPSICCDL